MPYTYTYGSGTENDPYQVWTAADLDGVRDYRGSTYQNTYFKQMADIDLDSYGDWLPLSFKYDEGSINWGRLWIYFDGNHYAISNINIPSTWEGEDVYLDSFFGQLEAPSSGWPPVMRYKNINLINVTTNNENSGITGGFCAEIVGRVGIENCKVINGDIKGLNHVGGFIGNTWGNGHFKNCLFTGNVSGPQEVGGFIGLYYYSCWVENCVAHATVTVRPSTTTPFGGGFIGYVGYYDTTTPIENCYCTGTLIVDNVDDGTWTWVGIGGFTGGRNAYIRNCYTRTNIVGINVSLKCVGGFVGYFNWGIIENCYAANEINLSGTIDETGGLIGVLPDHEGYDLPEVINSYYDSETSGQSDTGKGEPRTTAQMTYPYSEPENVYINWAFYGEHSDPVWQHDKEGLKYDVTQTLNDPVFIIDTCLVHGPDRSFVEYRYLAYLLHQKTYWDGASLIFAGHDLTDHIKEYNDITYLPVRYIAQDLLGLSVVWDEPNWQVHIAGKVTGPINDGYPHFIRGLMLKYKYMIATKGGTINYL
jgi:hypothetical protein